MIQALLDALQTIETEGVITTPIYGPPPENYYADFSGTVTAQTAATVLTLTNMTPFDGVSFAVYAMTGTTPMLSIYPSFDGTNFEIQAVGVMNLQTNSTIGGGTGITTAGIFSIHNASKYRSLRFDYTASVAGNCSVRGGIWKR